MDNKPKSCEICNDNEWEPRYHGRIRNGKFGNYCDSDHTVWACRSCGVERLSEKASKGLELYEKGGYKELMAEPSSEAVERAKYNFLQLEYLNIVTAADLRDKKVADIGCGPGCFLDAVKEIASIGTAIEPCKVYHESLVRRGYEVYSTADAAVEQNMESVDFAFSFAAIEHVNHPVNFLKNIKQLLKPEARLLVSTPNRNDIMMHLLGDDYKSFFYRSVHRWYFDAKSLEFCAGQAGFRVVKTFCVHRFGLNNALLWLRDRRPQGNKPLPYHENGELDELWRNHLTAQGAGDYLYQLLQPETVNP